MATKKIDVGREAEGTSRPAVFSVWLIAAVAMVLVTYKGSAALQKLGEARNSAVHWTQQPAGLGAVHGSLAYLRIVWPALVFGIVLSAAVRAAVPSELLARLFGREGARERAGAALTGAPLMLCACCSAPIFQTVYKPGRALGPALALMLSPPSLNPASLTLTFLLLPGRIAAARLVMAVTLVAFGTALVARLSGDSALPAPAKEENKHSGLAVAFMRSLAHVTIRTVPWIVVGIFLSFWIAARVPLEGSLSVVPKPLLMFIASAIALLLTLPTFFEIPLAVSAFAAGAPAGVAAVILFAGPAVNLPSLFIVGRNSSWRTAVLVGAVVLLIAVTGGLAVGR